MSRMYVVISKVSNKSGLGQIVADVFMATSELEALSQFQAVSAAEPIAIAGPVLPTSEFTGKFLRNVSFRQEPVLEVGDYTQVIQ